MGQWRRCIDRMNSFTINELGSVSMWSRSTTRYCIIDLNMVYYLHVFFCKIYNKKLSWSWTTCTSNFVIINKFDVYDYMYSDCHFLNDNRDLMQKGHNLTPTFFHTAVTHYIGNGLYIILLQLYRILIFATMWSQSN